MTAPDDDDDIRAAEYVLGLLDDPERGAARARAEADAVFAKRVEAWEVRFAPMSAGTEIDPPESVWQAIAGRLAVNDDEGPGPRIAALRRWQFAAIGASALAASLAILLATRPAPDLPPPLQTPPAAASEQPVLVASLQDDASASAVTISVEDAGGRLLVTPVRLPADGRAPELWIIPEDGTPRSLGVIEAAVASRVAVAKQHRAHIHSGATFAISMEPSGGSPTGAPTGPITATGKISRI